MRSEPPTPPGTVPPSVLWRLVRTLWLIGLILTLAVGLALPLLVAPVGSDIPRIILWVWLLVSMVELAAIVFLKRQARARVRQRSPTTVGELINAIFPNWLMLAALPLTAAAFAGVTYWQLGDRAWHAIFTAFALAGYYMAWPTLEQYRDLLPWMPPA